MKLIQNRNRLVGSGVSICIAAIAVANVLLTNDKNVKTSTTVSNAHAAACVAAPGMKCYFTGEFGDYFISDFENI